METTTFHRRHPETRLAVLLLGALVLWVGSTEVTAARPQSRRPRQSIQTRHAKTRVAWSRSSSHRHTVHRVKRQAARPPATPGVAYRKQPVGAVTAHVVQVDLNRADIHVTVGIANGGIGRWETWSGIINRLRPTAAITGTYYDPATLLPVGTIIANGSRLHHGVVGTALTFTRDNRVRFTRGRIALAAPELETALRAGPRLIDQGRVSLMPAVEGFRDPSILVRKPRAAVGLTKQNKLLLVTVTRPLYLREMARVMLALGASNAMCMDGGSSAGLYYAGKSYQVPRRVMTNLLVVYAGPRALARMKKA